LKSVRTIVDQVDAMKRLVNEFRDYARLPSADLQPLNLHELITDVLQLYAPENATVPVVCEFDERCPAIMGDAQQIRQVLHNLLQNAQDASEAAAGSRDIDAVIVRTRWLEAAHQVRLSVLDRGTGFPEHILKRAFEPYVTTKSKGTGLGLAVVRKIADEHGARVDVANRMVDGEVRGAQVSLSFPIHNTGSA
jgi:nitrogen fixation/metabolism regulation signal transduction histidine kinase